MVAQDGLALEPIDRLRHIPAHGLTARAVLVGVASVAVLSWAIPYSDLFLQGTWISSCHLPVGAFLFFFLQLLFFRTFVGWVKPRAGLSRAELLHIYVMMLVASGVPSFGLTAYLFPTLAGMRYFASPENKWAETFYSYVPSWLVPQSESVTRSFFEGLQHGEPLPWREWVVPTAVWTALALIVFAGMMNLCAVLRKQWLEHERLSFPLVQLPLAMVRGADQTRVPAFFRSGVMWLGLALPLILHSVNGLHHYFPVLPRITLVHSLNQYFRVRPWNQMGMFIIWVHFSVIGFTFLLPTQLSFSLWFFFLLSKVQSVAATSLGYQLSNMPDYPVQTYAAMQMLGAFALIALYMAWVGRPQLALMWRAAVFGRPAPEEEREPISYRTAWVGLGVTALFACVWLSVAGMSFVVAVLAYVITFLISIVLTRIVAECGLLFIQAPFRPSDLMIMCVGSRALGPRNLTTLMFFQRVFAFDLRAFMMPSVMNAFKLGEQGPLKGRHVVFSSALGIIVAIAVSYWAFLHTAYTAGGLKLQAWFLLWSPQQPFTRLNNYLTNPAPPNPGSIAFVAVGIAVAYALYWLRSRFVWWPLHPVGYAMGPSWPMIQLWFSTLVGWAAKTTIMRYGGYKGLLRVRPFFLGLVLGEFTAAGLWIVVAIFTGPPGYRFFLT